jgi:hypothetical protein
MDMLRRQAREAGVIVAAGVALFVVGLILWQ